MDIPSRINIAVQVGRWVFQHESFRKAVNMDSFSDATVFFTTSSTTDLACGVVFLSVITMEEMIVPDRLRWGGFWGWNAPPANEQLNFDHRPQIDPDAQVADNPHLMRIMFDSALLLYISNVVSISIINDTVPSVLNFCIMGFFWWLTGGYAKRVEKWVWHWAVYNRFVLADDLSCMAWICGFCYHEYFLWLVRHCLLRRFPVGGDTTWW